MTYHDLIHLIDHPEHLNEDTLSEVVHLLEDYPYFQTARLLYIMNLLAVRDSGFSSELKKSAFYVNDRKNLFYKLNGDQFHALRIRLESDLPPKDTFSLIDSFLKETGETATLFPDIVMMAQEKKEESIVPITSYRIEDKYSDDKPSVALKYQDVIDRFLEKDEEEPIKISLPEENKNLKPAVEAKQEEELPFFSETLAKIYIKQQKYEKAIEIISKLSLLYPEKSVYFADQIRFLNKLIINAKK